MESTLLILGPVFMATIMPGPSMLLAMDHGLRFGSRRTVPTALGNVAATIVQAAVSLAGLKLVALGSAQVLSAIRLAGVLYLGYLGLQMLRASGGGDLRTAPGAESPAAGFRRFRQAFFVTLWNPTAYLFFAALFPQFLDRPSGLSVLVFGLLLPTLGITFTCMMLYARFGQGLVGLLTAPSRARRFRILMGLSFLGLGVWMGIRR